MEPTTDFQYPEFSFSFHQVLQAQDRHTVLVINSDEHVRSVLRDSLRSAFTMLESRDAISGLEMARKQLPDLIIIDWIIPEVLGESICFRLKQDAETSHIPIIVLTTRDDSRSRLMSFYLGADDFIGMPIQQLELQIRIQNLIQSRKKLREKFSTQLVFRPASVSAPSRDELFMQQAMRIIEENMSNPLFSSEDFARELGLSQTRLYRKLIALTGYASNDFIRKIRLTRAADLLDKQVGNVSEVAYQVGFNSLSYFAKCFKALHQYTPRDYARRGCA